MQISVLAFGLAAVIGLGTSLFAVYLPAQKQGRLSPLEGMRPVANEDDSAGPALDDGSGPDDADHRRGRAAVLWQGAAANRCLGVVRHIRAFSGIVLLIPISLAPLVKFVAFILSPILKLEGQLACRQILRRRVRTGLTVVVLFLGVTAGIAIANSAIDNIADVQNWRDTSIKADFLSVRPCPTWPPASTPTCRIR